MFSETKDTFLQLQEWLRLELMKTLVSGVARYQKLNIAAKNEEKKLACLKSFQ